MVSRNRTRRRSRNFAKVDGKSREVVWIPWQGAATTVVSGTQVVLETDMLGRYFADVGAEVPAGATILRIRGTYSISQTNANFTELRLTIWAVVLRESGTYGENPNLELVNPIWRDDRNFQLRSLETAAAAFSVEHKEFVIDSKAKRKLSATADRLELRALSEVATADVVCRSSGVVLLMLP